MIINLSGLKKMGKKIQKLKFKVHFLLCQEMMEFKDQILKNNLIFLILVLIIIL